MAALNLRITLAIALLSSPALAQATWHVDAAAGPPGDGSSGAPFATIQQGIDASTGGDTVQVAGGTYFEHVDFSGKAVTVRGAGAGITIVDGSDSGPVFRFSSGEGPDSRLESLSVTNGLGAPLVPNNQPVGGGLLILGAAPTVVDCLLLGNGANVNQGGTQYGGGAYIADGSPTFINTEINGNVSCSEGAGVSISGNASPTFDGCTISFNVTNSFPGLVAGGGVFSGGVMPLFTNCTFANNFSDKGGALAGPAHVQDSSFTSNQSSLGGAVADVTLLERCSFGGNRAECYFGESNLGGGAAFNSYLVDCGIGNNTAAQGGGVLQCTVENSSIAFNQANYTGNCQGIARGGGAKDSILIGCTVNNNTVEEGFGPTAGGVGGGLCGGSAERCIITDNFADQGGGAALCSLLNCTVAGNEVRLAGGSWGAGWTVDATNCIVWGNGTASGATGELDAASTADYSIVKGGFPGFAILAEDPYVWGLSSLSDFELKPGSPAIDSGDPNSSPDPDGSVADRGALPFDPTHIGGPDTFCLGKLSTNFCLSVLTWSGTPLLRGSDFQISVNRVERLKNGILFYGAAASAIPFFGGTLCVAPPLARTPIQNSGGGVGNCSGKLQHVFSDADLGLFGTTVAYDSLYAQFWYRDNSQPDGTGVVLTRALEFVILP